MAQFTQKAILSTFQAMLEEMPFDKITVSALVKRCEISSNTFYYHFRDIYDLLDNWLMNTFQMFVEKPDFSWREAAKEFLYVCQKNKKIVYHLSKSLSRERLEQYFFSQSNDYFVRYIKDIAGDRTLPETFASQLAEFCRYSTTGFFLRFLWNQMDEDIDKSVDRLADMFDGFVESAIEQFFEDSMPNADSASL